MSCAISLGVFINPDWVLEALSKSIQQQTSLALAFQQNSWDERLVLGAERLDVLLVSEALLQGLTPGVIQGVLRRRPHIKLVVLAACPSALETIEVFKPYISAACFVDLPFSKLLKIIDMVAEGATWFDPRLYIPTTVEKPMASASFLSPVSAPMASGDTSLSKLLTRREQDVLQLITSGRSNKEIASALQITTNTVKIHVSNVIQKLGVSDRTQVAIKAIQCGLLPQSDDAKVASLAY